MIEPSNIQQQVARELRGWDKRLSIFNDMAIGGLALRISNEHAIHGIPPLSPKELAGKVYEILNHP